MKDKAALSHRAREKRRWRALVRAIGTEAMDVMAKNYAIAKKVLNGEPSKTAREAEYRAAVQCMMDNYWSYQHGRSKVVRRYL